jgi:hypothetical protein
VGASLRFGFDRYRGGKPQIARPIR